MHFLKCGRDTGNWDELNRVAETMKCSEVTVGPGRTKVSYPQVLLNGTRTRDQLSKNGFDAVVGKWSFVSIGYSVKDKFLTRWILCQLATCRF